MPDEKTGSTETQGTEAPHGTEETQEVNWEEQAKKNLSESRKHERRAKENRELYEKTKAELETLKNDVVKRQRESEAKERQDEGAKIEDAYKRIEELEASIQREHMVREVASEMDVDPEILLLMSCESKSDAEANAKRLLDWKAKRPEKNWPSIVDNGANATAATSATVDEILAMKDPKKQLEAIKQSRSLITRS